MSFPVGQPLELGDEYFGLVTIRLVANDQLTWARKAEEAARKLHAFGFTSRLRDPGRYVYFQFNMGLPARDQIDAAILAFNCEWSRLVPGWKPPVPQTPSAQREAPQ